MGRTKIIGLLACFVTLVACGSDDNGVAAGSCDPLGNGGGCGAQDKACYLAAKENSVAYACYALGTKAIGEACQNLNDCVAGAFCNPTSSAVGTCRQYCRDLNQKSSCGDGQECTVELSVPTGGSKIGYCTQVGCDPLAPTCAGDEGCYVRLDNTTACLPALQNLEDGATCTAVGQCKPGLDCSDPKGGANFACHRYCDRTAASSCGDGQTCVDLKISAQPKLGVCAAN